MEADSSLTDAFGEVISSYSRAQAIEDGVLVDLRKVEGGALASTVAEAGIKYPICMTQEAFSSCVALTAAAKRAGQDMKGRLWDVLYMFTLAVRGTGRAGDTQDVYFDVLVSIDRVRPTKTRFRMNVGPGDSMEPVLTLGRPEEF